MTVTDHQVATLRAMLAGEFDEFDRLRGQLGQDADSDGYSALISAGFFEAADRRFSPATTDADIIEFVAGVRASSDHVSDRLNPQAAESVIRAVLGRPADTEFDNDTIVSTQNLLLTALVADASMNGQELDKFMGEARALADRWLS